MARAAIPVDKRFSGESALFLDEVLQGLRRPQKELPCKYFYDRRGSELFDLICTLEEYYPTRTELAIMNEKAPVLKEALGTDVLLIEYGSGSSLKTRVLLSTLDQMAGYIPIDISRQYLAESAAKLRREFPGVPIHPICGDYTQTLRLPPSVRRHENRVVYYPGSTIGNFYPADAQRFLERIAALAGPGGHLLIGVDIRKDSQILEAAYNDEQGVTAAFNLNILTRINTELGGDFDIEAFHHAAPYNAREGRIEMHLVSRRRQSARVAGCLFTFDDGESIRTECSYKYTLTAFTRLAAAAGFVVEEVYLDSQALFSVQLLRVV
jgi:dimethylhistidine N-methyltransferase